MSKRKAVAPQERLAPDDLAQQLKDANISRSTYYYRRTKRGLSHEEALAAKKAVHGGTAASSRVYQQSIEFAHQHGLLTKAVEAPSLQTFTKYITQGLPPKLAILAQAKPSIEDRAGLFGHALVVASDPETSQALLNNAGFNGGVLAVLSRLEVLTPEQVVMILARLTRSVAAK